MLSLSLHFLFYSLVEHCEAIVLYQKDRPVQKLSSLCLLYHISYIRTREQIYMHTSKDANLGNKGSVHI